MIQRCVDIYDGHWCPCCGSCTCRAPGQPSTWAPAGSDDRCPMHGAASAHGHVKVLTVEPDNMPRRGFRTRVQDRNMVTDHE